MRRAHCWCSRCIHDIARKYSSDRSRPGPLDIRTSLQGDRVHLVVFNKLTRLGQLLTETSWSTEICRCKFGKDGLKTHLIPLALTWCIVFQFAAIGAIFWVECWVIWEWKTTNEIQRDGIVKNGLQWLFPTFHGNSIFKTRDQTET